MKLTLIFSIVFAFLTISCRSQISSPSTSEATTVDVTTVVTTDAPTAAGSTSSDTAGTTGSPGSTNSPGPTVSTLSPASEGPSSENPTAQTTIPPVVTTTEEPPTTQADVWAEFDLDCNTTENYCVYKINAPQLDAAQYNEQNSKLQTDKAVYKGLSSKTYFDSSSFYANKVYQDYQNVKEMVQNLTLQMQALRDTVNESLTDVQSQSASIADALLDIKTIYSNLTTCYYQKCALSTPPPITTTTTPRPTTLNICGDYSCETPGGLENNGTCLVVSGKPTCKCPVNCYSSPAGLTDGTVPGPFWSPGYTGGPNPTSYASKLNCIYKISSENNIKITVNSINMDPNTNLIVNGKAIPPGLKDATALTGFIKNTILHENTKMLTITFKTPAKVPTSGGPYYIDWNISDV
uniref:CUB domain-containing protein n=1 Tax=Panagrolaimus sp. ES5 TaxID=591445 RepID=A0AC34GU09_9BILA